MTIQERGSDWPSAEPRITRDILVAGKRVIVIDDALGPEAIEWFDRKRNLEYKLNDYDSPETEHSLHWKREIDLKSPETRALSALVYEVFRGRSLRLVRAHYNLLLYGDVQFPHVDGPPGSVTLVLFANRVWRSTWMGETIFYENPEEPTIAVLPRPGRVVIFEGDILHRAGVPQRECFEPRLSFSMKFRPADG